MDLSSPNLSDKTRLINRTDSTLQKGDSSPEFNDSNEPMVQRCVIIQKDEKGYGLTVSGDNPVFVQSVKEDGAAARAGVKKGDRIIKVNGTLVTQTNHKDVVELIKSGSYVALTLLGKSPSFSKGTVNPSYQSTSPTMNIINSNKSESSERITGPQPVDPEKQQQLTNSRIHTIRKMLEKEVVYLENLRAEFSKTPSEKIQSEVNGAKKRVKTLEEQLLNLTGIPHEHIISRSPKSPPTGRHGHDRESHRSVSFPAHVFHNRPLTHQTSAPVLPANPLTHYNLTSPTSLDGSNSHFQVILSPCNDFLDKKVDNPCESQKQSISTSLENIAKHLSQRTTTWPQHTHSRQSSSPETLQGIENLKCQKSNGYQRPDSLHRSVSAVTAPHGGLRNSVLNSECKTDQSRNSTQITPLISLIGQSDSAMENSVPSPPSSSVEPQKVIQSTDVDESTEEFLTTSDQPADEISFQPIVSKLSQNTNIICMEDDDFSSDTEMGHLEDHGPFNGFFKLVRNPAHLSVFLHYLMSNSDPSSLFFYLISKMYEEGTGREMKKWAYEIHSSFLVPGAPLKVSLVDETILHKIDEVLLNHIDKEEILRTVFKNARDKAKEELNEFLADFRNKRTMGLANIFGPRDCRLVEAMHDKTKEVKIIEQLLAPCLDNFSEDVEGIDDRTLAKTYALATVLKLFGIKNPHYVNIIEKMPTFVAKDKSFFTSLLPRGKKVMLMQGHHFVPEHYYSVTFCNHCQLIIWGIGFQGYQCQNCEMNIHKSCVKVVEEHCIGALRNKKERMKEKDREKVKRDRRSGIVENLIAKTRKPSQPVPAAIERAKKLNEEMNSMDNGISSESNRGLEHLKEPTESVFQNMLNLSESLEKSYSNKKVATSIGRSESFRQTRESKPSFRKRSDPNIPRSKSDVEVDDKHNTGLNESRSSSNSSLSNRSLDSPCHLGEMVHRTNTSVSADSVPANFAPNSTLTSSHSSQLIDDSDLEADADSPQWQENVDWDVLKVMKPKEKKRQDVINELFHTERTHVRNLKVLDRLFYKPMLQEQLLPVDFLTLLFPNLEEMLDIHSTFNNKMKARRKTESVIGDIGQLMLEMFDGEAGLHLKHAAATYCENQSIALESLKVRQKKDQKLALSLSDAEANNLCRRLQLKDIIASGFQRLTKYPLLLENIAKYTPPNTQELSDLQRAVECSKEILVHVDSAIKEAENMHRLLDIQKKMEKTSFEKVEHPIVESFKSLDVTKRKLLHEGPLQWRLSKQKIIDMHVVLMEDILILFQKQDEKFVLKFHNTILTVGREDTKVMHSPILRVQNLMTRENATDKKTFFIISSSEMQAIYEFVASSPIEKRLWCTQVDKIAEEQKNRNTVKETPPPAPNSLMTSQDRSDDVEDVTKSENSTVNTELLQSGPDTNFPPEEKLDSVSIDESPQRAAVESHTDEEKKSLTRIEHIEILEITEGLQLIEPSEVIISNGTICETAEPVLAPLEKLRRKDLEISKAMLEKELIAAEILQRSVEELKNLQVKDISQDLSPLDIATVAFHQGNQIASFINEGLSLQDMSTTQSIDDSEETTDSNSMAEADSPAVLSSLCEQKGIALQCILPASITLNQCLAQLLVLLKNSEDEKQQLRRELASYQEQVHQLHEAHRHCTTSHSSSIQSRPSSFVSVGSTASDGIAEFFESQHLLAVAEKAEDVSIAASDPKEESTTIENPLSSSLKSEEIVLPSERWTEPPTSHSELWSNPPPSETSEPADPIFAHNADDPSIKQASEDRESESCRTIEEEKNVDPVYL